MPAFIVAVALALSITAERDKMDVCLQWIPPLADDGIFVRSLQSELDAIFRQSAITVITSPCIQHQEAPMIVIPCEIRGSCEGNPDVHAPGPDQRLLGWAHTLESRTPSRIGIDCGAIASFIRRVRLHGLMERPILFERAAARVLSHEILHVLLNSAHKPSSELCHAGLATQELYMERRLTVEELNQLRETVRSRAVKRD